jgi:septum site-determining protein MinC
MPAQALTEAAPLPAVRMRGRSIMALVLSPQFPISDWFAGLDQHMRTAPAFFAGRPVVANLEGVAEAGVDAAMILLDGLGARGLRLVGAEGLDDPLLAATRWSHLATVLQGRDLTLPERPVVPEAPAAAGRPGSRLVDRPIRSGESLVVEEGDVIVLGHVASGAEVLAGGSIHVYGALRGRAIAGLSEGAGARIFCRRLEAEMVGIDRLYRTAEHWGPKLHGAAVQVLCDRGALRLSPLD